MRANTDASRRAPLPTTTSRWALSFLALSSTASMSSAWQASRTTRFPTTPPGLIHHAKEPLTQRAATGSNHELSTTISSAGLDLDGSALPTRLDRAATTPLVHSVSAGPRVLPPNDSSRRAALASLGLVFTGPSVAFGDSTRDERGVLAAKKMARVPAFTITTADGEQPYFTDVDKSGTPVGFFFIERADAEAVLPQVGACWAVHRW